MKIVHVSAMVWDGGSPSALVQLKLDERLYHLPDHTPEQAERLRKKIQKRIEQALQGLEIP